MHQRSKVEQVWELTSIPATVASSKLLMWFTISSRTIGLRDRKYSTSSSSPSLWWLSSKIEETRWVESKFWLIQSLKSELLANFSKVFSVEKGIGMDYVLLPDFHLEVFLLITPSVATLAGPLPIASKHLFTVIKYFLPPFISKSRWWVAYVLQRQLPIQQFQLWGCRWNCMKRQQS